MAKITFQFKSEEIFGVEEVKSQKIYFLQLTGKAAYTTSHVGIRKLLMSRYGYINDWIKKVYTYNIGTYYVQLSENAINKIDPHGQTFSTSELTISITDTKRRRDRLQLRYVPPFTTDRVLNQIGETLFEGDFSFSRVKDYDDRVIFLYEPQTTPITTHYLNIETEDKPTHRIQVLLPGRKQVCYFCLSETHWTTQCRYQKEENQSQPSPYQPPPPKPATPPSSDSDSSTPPSPTKPAPAIPETPKTSFKGVTLTTTTKRKEDNDVIFVPPINQPKPSKATSGRAGRRRHSSTSPAPPQSSSRNTTPNQSPAPPPRPLTKMSPTPSSTPPTSTSKRQRSPPSASPPPPSTVKKISYAAAAGNKEDEFNFI